MLDGHKIRTVIIDDEVAAIQLLNRMINRSYPDLEVVGTAIGPVRGQQVIRDTKPEVVFVDIEMPFEDGITLIDRFENRNFYVVFYTAYSNYAVQAIKMGAFDYLLKPIEDDDLCSVISRVKRAYVKALTLEKAKTESGPKITLRTGRRQTRIIDCQQILRVDAEGSYSLLHLKTDEIIMVSKNLKKVEQMIDCDYFMRIHNSHVVNMREVDMWCFPERYCVMSNKKQVPLSVRRKEDIKYYLNDPS